jgi:branched-chain amino acid transport system permease protein
MSRARLLLFAGTAILIALPAVMPAYFLHLMIQILIWAFIYTAWALMGRFGFVSFGHGAFLGLGAYVPALLWNYWDVTPWLGIPLSVIAAVLLAVIVGYPCFRRRVVGHYFALVTLALSQVVLLSLIAARDVTGGSLGFTQKAVGHSWYALQFPEKGYFYAIALLLWLAGLLIWQRIDRGIGREALEAISDDEDAAAAIGIDVTREKMRVTVISAALTAVGGAIYGQYVMYLNPDTVSGIAVSLQIVFAAIAGGVYSLFGPSVGALLTLLLTEGLRVWFGTNFIGAANTIYGILLILATQAGRAARCPSERHAAPLLGGPITGIVHLDRFKGQGQIGERLPAGRDTFHEILYLLLVAARPFLFEADILPPGLPIDLFGDIDARELLLAGLIAHHVGVWRNIGEQRAPAGIGFDQIAYAAHDHVAGINRRLGAIGERERERAPILDVDRIGFDETTLIRP